MRRLTVAALLAVAATAVAGATQASGAATLCVGNRSGCFSSLQAAIKAAHNGDTIHMSAGTYAGPVTIDASIKLIGAGVGSTIIRGGGPVLTIGTFGASSEPTVSIGGVTITGGVTHTSWAAAFLGDDVVALGGGIEVPPGDNGADGATLSIANSLITGNLAAPTATALLGPPCPAGLCPVAFAGGGGIDSFGVTTLTNTTVSDNQVGGPIASTAYAGGIYVERGRLTLKHSVVTRNEAIASAPNGRYADTGGVLAELGTALTVDDSLISNNSASLSMALPSSVESLAGTGGIHIQGDDSCATPSSDCATATIKSSTITGNSATASNTTGNATDACGGICDDGSLELRHSIVADNHVTATVPVGSTASASASSGGVGAGGIESIGNTRIIGNTVLASAPDGFATAGGGGASTGNHDVSETINDTLIRGNRVTAMSATGSVAALGAGLAGAGLLRVHSTTISGNSGAANGPDGVARGGGVWNAAVPDDPVGRLTMTRSSITGNSLTADRGVTIEGGGLFTIAPVALHGTTIAYNVPDQRFDAERAAQAPAPAFSRSLSSSSRVRSCARRFRPSCFTQSRSSSQRSRR